MELRHLLSDDEGSVVLSSLLDNLDILNDFDVLRELREVELSIDLGVVGYDVQHVRQNLHLDLLGRLGRLLVLGGDVGDFLLDNLHTCFNDLYITLSLSVSESGNGQQQSEDHTDFEEQTFLVIQVSFG